jgi:Galactosyltransferase
LALTFCACLAPITGRAFTPAPCASVRLRSEQAADRDAELLRAEVLEFNDIIRLDVVDTYSDLPLKTLHLFSVMPQRFDADFYFKVDDDIALNVGALADFLAARRTQGNLYMVGLAWAQTGAAGMRR